jgi:pilus assembly protein CpaB
MRAGGLLTLLMALALGAVAAFMARSWLEGQAVANISPTAPAASNSIVVASRDIGFGTELSSDNLIEIEWSSSALPEGAFRSREELLSDGRRVALSAIRRNEPVMEWKVTGPGQRASLAALIEDGMKAVTVGVDVVRGVAGFVLPGERVDLALTRNTQGGEGVTSDILLQNVRVLAVDQVTDDQRESPTVARAVTLEVTTEQAQKVIVAQNVGSLSLILRQAGATGAEANRRITAADLVGSEYVGGNSFGELTLAELEAEAEARENGTVPPESVAAPAEPAFNPYARVGVVRGTKRDEYSVLRDER